MGREINIIWISQIVCHNIRIQQNRNYRMYNRSWDAPVRGAHHRTQPDLYPLKPL